MSAENVIFVDVFAVKFDGSDVYPGISLYENSFQIPGLTSLPSHLTAKKSMKMKFLAEKVYYSFYSGESIGIQIQIRKISTDVLGTLKCL